MKTFLKVFLLVLALIVAVKLLPLTLLAGCFMGVALAIFLALGFSAIAVIAVAVIALAAVLAPIWIPVLLVIGLIALIKRCTRTAPVNS